MPVATIQHALDGSVGFAKAAGGRYDEVSLVHGLFRAGIPFLRRRLPVVMAKHGRRVSVGGVFCHGNTFRLRMQPIGHSCEVGDLLVVVRDDSTSQRRNLALLLRAKKQTQGARPTMAQRLLYEQWPTFQWSHGRIPQLPLG
jgi:hypothetical protein